MKILLRDGTGFEGTSKIVEALDHPSEQTTLAGDPSGGPGVGGEEDVEQGGGAGW